jgi:hypothetical protein
LCATLQNHDGVNGADNNHGLWAKIWNIETGNWLETMPFSVNQTGGMVTQSAIGALPGLKFLVAYIVKGPRYHAVVTRLFTPDSSSNVITNNWIASNNLLPSYWEVLTGKEFHNLHWLKVPKESKVLLTWVQLDLGFNRTKGKLFDMNTGGDFFYTHYFINNR